MAHYKKELRSPLNKFLRVLVMLIVIAIPTVWLTWNIVQTETLHCTVCMEYDGQKKCRSATGPDQEQCQRTASDNACAFLASGMTNSMACGRTKPVSVEFKN